MSTKICKESAYVNTLKSNTVHVGKSKKNLHCPTKTCAELGSLNRPVESLKEAIKLVKDKKMENVSVLMAAGDYSKTDFDLEIPKEIRQIIGEGRSVTTIGNGLQIKHSLDLQNLTIGTDPSKMAITVDFAPLASDSKQIGSTEMQDKLEVQNVAVEGQSKVMALGSKSTKSANGNMKYGISEKDCEHKATSTKQSPCTKIEVKNGATLHHSKTNVTESYKQGDDDNTGKPLREKSVDATSAIKSSNTNTQTEYEICKDIDTINHHYIEGTYEHKRNYTQRTVVSSPGCNLTKDAYMNGYKNYGNVAIEDNNSRVKFADTPAVRDTSSTRRKFVSKVENNGRLSAIISNRTTSGASGGRKLLTGTSANRNATSRITTRINSTKEYYENELAGEFQSQETADGKNVSRQPNTGLVFDSITSNGGSTFLTLEGMDAQQYALAESKQDADSQTTTIVNGSKVGFLGSFETPGFPNSCLACCAVRANNIEVGDSAEEIATVADPRVKSRIGALKGPLVGSFKNALVQLSSCRSSRGELHFGGGTQVIMDNVGLDSTAVKSFPDEETGNRPTIEFLKSRSSHSTDHNFELEHGTIFKAASSILQQRGQNSLVSFRASRLARNTVTIFPNTSTVDFASCQLSQVAPEERNIENGRPMIDVRDESSGADAFFGTSSATGNHGSLMTNAPSNPPARMVTSGSNLIVGNNKTQGVAVVGAENMPAEA